jgi:hypothetical protein
MDMMKDFIKMDTITALGSEPEDNWKSKFKEYNIDYRQITG